jgi:lysyl-tRNA synthetase, class II
MMNDTVPPLSTASVNKAETAIPQSAAQSIRANRLAQLDTWRQEGINPYPYTFDRSHQASEIHHQFSHLQNAESAPEIVTVAGRLMAIRNSGMFLDLHDTSGKIQVVCHKEHLDPTLMDALKRLDVGDIVGITGCPRRTPRGELSIQTHRFTLLSKALLPLPEKFHGLTDQETRYRQRYLDLIMNADSRDTLRKRSQLLWCIRQFLNQQGFIEVETPMLQSIAGGAAARPFLTHHNTLNQDMSLRIAPELFLKRLMVGGLGDKLFEMNRNFRNEGISPKHNPEFTMLELYQSYADYHDMMDLLEALVIYLANTVLGDTTLQFADTTINLKGPWERLTMIEAVKRHTGLDFNAYATDADAQHAVKTAQCLTVNNHDTWGFLLNAVFEEHVEPLLIQPVHIIDYPLEMSPLSKIHRSNPRLVERFETRVYGWEIANAFSELNDPVDQRGRFEAQLVVKATLATDTPDETHPMDEDYITALEYALPPTGGMGIGIDRLVMLLTNSQNIRDVIAFPTLRHKLA